MAGINLEQLPIVLRQFNGITENQTVKKELQVLLNPYFSFNELCLINIENNKASVEMRTMKYFDFDETLFIDALFDDSMLWVEINNSSMFRTPSNVESALVFQVKTGFGKAQCLVFLSIEPGACFNELESMPLQILLQQVAHQLEHQTRLNRQKFHSTSLLSRLAELSNLFNDFASEWFWKTTENTLFTNVLTSNVANNLYKRHFLNKTFDDVITEHEQTQLKKWSQFKHLLSEQNEFIDFEFEINSSPQAWVSFSGKPQYDANGHFKGYMGIAKDITVNKDREYALNLAKNRAEEASLAKSQFLTVMSHEIRTPMNAIVGMLELLADSELNEKQSRWLNYANTSADLLLDLISDVLDFSKIESGSLQLDVKATDIYTLVKNIASQFLETSQSTGVIFSSEIKTELPKTIDIDSARVGQILFNILDNAIKFTKVGTVNFKVDSNEKELIFEISDTGQGMSQSQLETIYDAFKQHDDGVNRQAEGIGLGLSITKSLVDLMKGTITVVSEPNVGTKFTIVIPFTLVKETTHTQEQEQSLEPISILVTEDNKTNQVLIKTFLEKLNHHVTLADNGQQAIEKVQASTFDLVLMDMMMPVMDGISATKYMREKLNLTIPIVALTANASKQDKSACLEAGMDKVLTKPIRFHDLNRALRILFSQ